MTEQEIIQLFITAAEEHAAVKWSDVGATGFLFNPQRDIIFPAFFLQPSGAVVSGTTKTDSYSLYVMDVPTRDVNVDNQAFEWDVNDVSSRDTTLQIIQDIIGKVRVENGIYLNIDLETLTQDNEQLDGAVGWRADISVSQSFLTTNEGFPT